MKIIYEVRTVEDYLDICEELEISPIEWAIERIREEIIEEGLTEFTA